jgi:hypothetical protein
MSYIFPRRLLRTGDVLDPIELTLDLSPAAERLSGRLNAHNFTTDLTTLTTVDPEAFYALEYYQDYVAFIFAAGPPTHGYPDHGDNIDAYQVQNNFEWQSITNASSETPRISITTGGSVLWVNAYAQYLWHGFANRYRTPTPFLQHAFGSQTDPSGIQFAIRLDGNIVPETITGMDEVIYRASIPLKPIGQRTDTSPLPGPQDLRGQQIVSLGPPCLPIRITACLPVQAGDHTVEIVVRRVPVVLDTETKNYKEKDYVYVYSRQIFVADLKSFPVDSVASTDVSVPAFEEEDFISNATMYTQRVQPLIVGYNDVAEGNLQRGALMHYHLPTVLAGTPRTAERNFGSFVQFNSLYPGTGSNTVTTTAYNAPPATGWTLLTGLGTPIRIAGMDATVGRKILILANAQIRNIQGGDITSVDGNGNVTGVASRVGSFALFQIMWQTTGSSATSWFSLPESLGMVNNFVWWPKKPWTSPDPLREDTAPAYGLEQVEVQLMAVLDFSSVSPGAQVDIGLFGSVTHSVLNQGTEFEMRHGSIIAIPFRA